ncbi:MAG: hypothetical protein KJZ78_29050 [Bryobacteraceae bacterium]|nr:hypothetical protein [Bryobacteraceae bacterium]
MNDAWPIPSPADLLAEAQKVPPKFELIDYWKTVVTLRRRGLSWREVAAWMTERGVPIDHSAVYRFSNQDFVVRLLLSKEDERRGLVQEYLEAHSDEIAFDDELSGEMAVTNCSGPWVLGDWELSEARTDEDEGRVFAEISFSLDGEQDPGRPFCGSRISGNATLVVSVGGDRKWTDIGGGVSDWPDVDPEEDGDVA